MYSSPTNPSIILTVFFLSLFQLIVAENSRSSSSSSASLKSHSLLFSSQPVTTTQTPSPVEVPDFVEPIGNHTVAVGRDAQLACKINKLGSFRTAWLRVEDKGILTIHNNIITRNYRVGLINNDDEAKNFILTIKNVQPSDRGGYMCQINSVPMRYAIGYLDVLTPPVFDDENNNSSSSSRSNSGELNHGAGITVANEGSNASLSCYASGHPAPEIIWRREDNEPIRLSNQDEVPKVDGSTLVLAQVSRLNSGAYLCIASNGVQPSASKRQVLDVRYRPVIRLPQTEVETRLGQAEAQLICYADLNPLGSYFWAKLDSADQADGAGGGARSGSSPEDDDQALIEHYELINSDKHEIVMKQMNSETIQMVLTVRHIEKSDLARYKCIARNSLGTQSNSIRLHEPTSFSLNTMFGGRGTGSEPTSEPSTSSPDQQLNDQQDTGRAGTGPSRASQYLSTRANSRSSWIQRSSSSPSKVSPSSSEASSAHPLTPHFSFSPLVSLLSLNSIIVASIAQIIVVFVVDRTVVRRLPNNIATGTR